jgi:hypothetical protein
MSTNPDFTTKLAGKLALRSVRTIELAYEIPLTEFLPFKVNKGKPQLSTHTIGYPRRPLLRVC